MRRNRTGGNGDATIRLALRQHSLAYHPSGERSSQGLTQDSSGPLIFGSQSKQGCDAFFST